MWFKACESILHTAKTLQNKSAYVADICVLCAIEARHYVSIGPNRFEQLDIEQDCQLFSCQNQQPALMFFRIARGNFAQKTVVSLHRRLLEPLGFCKPKPSNTRTASHSHIQSWLHILHSLEEPRLRVNFAFEISHRCIRCINSIAIVLGLQWTAWLLCLDSADLATSIVCCDK